MKTKLCILIFTLAAAFARAQTTNLTALLQQGLFEEQANRNLDAAISDYQTLATQFDKDRQLAATAIFRLGECYRMQGKTNEAALEYKRIVNEFSDQTTLATLSRQNLTGLGALASKTASAENSDAALWDKVKNLQPSELEKVLPTLVPDAVLTSLLQQRNAAETKLAELQVSMGPVSPDVLTEKAVLDVINKQISEKMDGIMQVLKMRAEISSSPVAITTPTDEESQEIQRIQTMIQNSPDLINAPNASNKNMTPLENAAAHGWLKVAAFLLDHGAKINYGAPLNQATQAGNRAMVEFLLSRGADVNNKGWQGDTPLFSAIGKDFQAVTKVLLANKANVNVESNQGQTPLSVAAEYGSPEMVKMILDAKADPNGGKLNAPLLCAIHEKDIKAAQLLLQAGADPNANGVVDWQPSWNWHTVPPVPGGNFQSLGSATPLWLAVDMDQFPMVQLLLKFKADPNDSQTDGNPVLFGALGHTNILEALLDAGGKADSRELNGWPLLDTAINQKTDVTAVQMLLQHGADANSKFDGDTPLIFAAEHWADRQIFELLLEHHADPNVRGNNGETPLDVLKEEFSANGYSPDQKALAGQLADLLRQHGALDNLPDWNSLKISRPSANFSETVFQKGTNDWNHFTLLELLYASRGRCDFPDFAHIVIIRPNADGKTPKRTEINLLNSTNGLDCSKDMTLEFGDTVEIPEREHTLADKDNWTGEQIRTIIEYLRGKAGEAKLIVAGGQTIQLPLKDFEPVACYIGSILRGSAAQNVLTSASDLLRVKVTRRDAKTGKKDEWILDCSRINQSNPWLYGAPDLWLRNGDVIEVPEKP